ncbi:MAG: hypothetical protein HZB39_09710 [Planctomycetes bacterium]|nr:hypothetical protein [Planctomycetota bacterium]
MTQVDEIQVRAATTMAWLLLFAAVATAQTTAPIAVDARCIGPNGEPVEGVEFGDRWGAAGGSWSSGFICPDPVNPLRLVSDADGRIAGTWTFSPMETPLLGWNRERTLAAFVLPSHDPVTHESFVRGAIAMRRTVTLRGTLRTTAPVAPFRLVVSWTESSPTPRETWFAFGSDRADFALALPPGRYELRAGAGHGGAPPRTIVVDGSRDELELGPISVPLLAFDLIGEVLPDWNVTQARNLALERASLGEFRGKPLLIHFDDYGNPSHMAQTTRDALAALATHPSRSSFHVVLFGPTRDLLAGLPERPVNPEFDRLFPRPKPPEPRVEAMFPLLSDDTGTTEARYGVLWGTALLDRDGRLLMHGDLASAIAALDRHLGAAR